MRFVFFGLALVGGGNLMRGFAYTAPFSSSTRIGGLLYHFATLWFLFVFGEDVQDLYPVGLMAGRIWRFVWPFAFFAATGVAAWYGLRYEDVTTKGFGLAFLGIGLCSKFFLFCWDHLYRPLFFVFLAGALAVVGRYAEDVWNLDKLL